VEERRRLEIFGMAHGGAGLGRPQHDDTVAPEGSEGDARVWFVPGTLQGETVVAEATRETKRFFEGRLVEVVTPAPERVEAPCARAHECGGCNWQHVDPAAQPRLKRDIVAGQLRRLPAPVGPVVASPTTLGYRRRARMHYVRTMKDGETASLVLGFHRPRSKSIVDLEHCPVLEAPIDRALQHLRGLAEFLPAKGEVLALSNGHEVVLGLPGVRPSVRLGEAVAAILDKELVGISVRGGRKRARYGQEHLEIDGGPGVRPVYSGPFAFAQAQAAQNAALVDHVVAESRAEGLAVLELYAGAGNFTRRLAEAARRVTAVDSDTESHAALSRLLRELGSNSGIDAVLMRAEVMLQQMAKKGRRSRRIVIDPPRGGLGRDACADLAAVASERIIYVSCDPATLARDIGYLVEHGFRCLGVKVFDMMPMTSEVECVATFERKDPSS